MTAIDVESAPDAGFVRGQFVRRTPQGQPWEVLGPAVDEFGRHGLMLVLRKSAIDDRVTTRQFALNSEPLSLASADPVRRADGWHFPEAD